MHDRNKTELTQNITRTTAVWLDGKGFKPVEREVSVERGWVADVAGVCCPTQTEKIALKLLKPAPRLRWRAGMPDDDPVLLKYRADHDAWKAARDAVPDPLTALIEVKTSVGDFRGDRKWTVADWPVNLCFVAMPQGMIPAEHWPVGWGVILCSQDGATVRKVHYPAPRQVRTEQQLNVVLSLAIVRDHATRYARMRELEKQVRMSKVESTTVARITNCVHFVRSVMEGKSIDAALRWHGIRAKLPPNVRRDLESLSARPNGSAAEPKQEMLPATPWATAATTEVL